MDIILQHSFQSRKSAESSPNVLKQLENDQRLLEKVAKASGVPQTRLKMGRIRQVQIALQPSYIRYLLAISSPDIDQWKNELPPVDVSISKKKFDALLLRWKRKAHGLAEKHL